MLLDTLVLHLLVWNAYWFSFHGLAILKGTGFFFFFLENHIVLNLFDVSCDSVLITYFFLPKQDLRNCRLSLHLLCSWGGRP